MKVAGSALVCAVAFSAADAQANKTGSRAPEINLPTLNGGRVKLSKLRGHPVIVSFWGTWCAPCRQEFPMLSSAQSRYADAGLLILAVNGRDQELSTSDVQRFVEALSVSFTVALDKRGSARRAYRISGQPATVFIDATGVIRGSHTGLISAAELDSGIALITPKRLARRI